MKAGDTFFLKDRGVDGGHPWIIVCDPIDGSFVAVNLTENNEFKDDKSCVLRNGCEGIVTKDSIVSYKDAKLITVSQFDSFTKFGHVIPASRVADTTIDAILKGFSLSQYTPDGVFEFLNENGLLPLD